MYDQTWVTATETIISFCFTFDTVNDVMALGVDNMKMVFRCSSIHTECLLKFTVWHQLATGSAYSCLSLLNTWVYRCTSTCLTRKFVCLISKGKLDNLVISGLLYIGQQEHWSYSEVKMREVERHFPLETPGGHWVFLSLVSQGLRPRSWCLHWEDMSGENCRNSHIQPTSVTLHLNFICFPQFSGHSWVI